MQGTTQCPTCRAVIAIGAGFCSTCGVALEWQMPGALPPTPPPVAPPPAPQGEPRRRRPQQERRSGSGAGIWIVAMVAVVGIAGGIIYWKKQQEAARPGGPVFAPGVSGAAAPKGAELSPYLARLSESYPRFYQDLSYEPPPAPVLPPPRGGAHRRKIVTEHDSFRDCTFVRLTPTSLDPKGSGGANAAAREGRSWAAYFGFRGSEPRGLPSVLTILLEVEPPGAPYGDDAAIQWLADGKLLTVVRNAWNETAEAGGTPSLQVLAFPTKVKDFLPLLDAKQVTLRIGAVEFEFGDADLDALKDLLGRGASGG